MGGVGCVGVYGTRTMLSDTTHDTCPLSQVKKLRCANLCCESTSLADYISECNCVISLVSVTVLFVLLSQLLHDAAVPAAVII